MSYTISGSAGVAGATITWTGTSSGSTTADSLGNYTSSGLTNGTYTVTPSLANYAFFASSQTITISGANVVGVCFTAVDSTALVIPSASQHLAGTLIAQDTFASGSLAAGWQTVTGLTASQVTGTPKVAEPTATSVYCGQIWTGTNFGNDHVSEVTVGTLTAEAASQINLYVRQSATDNSCYVLSFSNSGYILYLFDPNNTPHFLTSGSCAVSAGDVLTFEASGIFLGAYINGTQLFYTYRTDLSTGYPGFSQYTTSNVTHCSVASWRGYSSVKQDGIWQKQPIVIKPISADLTTTPAGQGLQLNTFMYEGNAQLLSGTVFKTWLDSQYIAGGNIYYAESYDAVNWTRSASPILSGYINATVFKYGSTYYLHAQADANSGIGPNAVFTGTDGINWTLQNANTITHGSGSTWDNAGIYGLVVVDVIAGTWYAMYEGTNGSGQFNAGLATSPDGINWTKYVSNPVITGGALPTGFAKVGNTYYGWFGSTQPQGNSHDNLLDPIEVARYQSTDLINWTNKVASSHHTLFTEGLNTTSGYTFVSQPINVGKQTYMLNSVGPSDGTTTSVGQISLSIAPVNIAQLVQQPEDAAHQISTDSFTSGTGNLSGNWTGPTYGGSGKAKIIAGNLCEAVNLNEVDIEVYTGASFNNDQYSEATIQTLSNAGDGVYLIVRASTSNLTYYQASIVGPTNNTHTTGITKWVAGSSTNLGPTTINIIPQVGDVFRLAVVGQLISLYQNGGLILQVEDTANSITSGAPGFYLYDTVNIANAQISKWSGGNMNVLPYTYNISGNAGVAGATVSYTGTASGSTTADGSGNYSITGLANGSYTLTPSLAGYTFSPVNSAQTVSGADITGVNFTSSSGYYSVPDCRNYATFPNTAVNVNGTETYTGQTSSNSAIPPTDSRKAGAPTASGTYPQNSRTPGTYGPGE